MAQTTKILLVVAVLAILLVGALYYMQSAEPQYTEESQESMEGDSMKKEGDAMMEEGKMMEGKGDTMMEEEGENVIVYSDSGYSPAELRIKIGETVMFKNESDREMWPASAMHPTHTVYPGSDIEKCDTPEEPNLFDSCRGVTPGDEWSFIFTKAGEWGYHDHLRPTHWGKVIVTE